MTLPKTDHFGNFIVGILEICYRFTFHLCNLHTLVCSFTDRILLSQLMGCDSTVEVRIVMTAHRTQWILAAAIVVVDNAVTLFGVICLLLVLNFNVQGFVK